VVSPSKSSIEVETKVFDLFRTRELHSVQVDRGARAGAQGKRHVDRFVRIGLHAPLLVII
jgi:hypothetical protein